MNPTARKLTALSLAAVMGLGLAACSGGSGNGDATGTASPTPGTTAEPTSYADRSWSALPPSPSTLSPMPPVWALPSSGVPADFRGPGPHRRRRLHRARPGHRLDHQRRRPDLYLQLVQGVKFSNGEDVEPSDWVWSFYRARDYETSNYRYIAEAIDTVEATDEQVVITLTEPNAAFLAELGCFNMVLGDQSYAESMSDEEYLKNPVGTGPTC